MAKAWSDKAEYKHLSGELSTSEDRDFERRVLPLVRILWPEAVGPPALKSFDRSGADHLVWSDKSPFNLVVQLKGFRSSEHELGASQIRQCKKSIDSFAKSKLKAKKYLLIHNRDGRSRDFRTEIETALNKLVDSKQVESAELWNRQKLLQEVLNRLLEKVRASFVLTATSYNKYYREESICEPLKQVPLKTSTLIADQYKLLQNSAPVSRTADPAKEILSYSNDNLIIMIGEAGYGKTTSALRSYSSDKKIFYVPAARISNTVMGTKDLLQNSVKLDEVLEDVEIPDIPVHTRLLRPVTEYILKDKDTPAVLILDGLDESIYFTRRGGLQSLFNQLHDINIPIILTARSEFWTDRQSDFTTSFGVIGQKKRRNLKKIKLVELLPWENDQIITISKRYHDLQKDTDCKRRIQNFIEVVEKGNYGNLYGDIPRRPLFLKFILETVAEHDIHNTNKAVLLNEWAEMKIHRDISRPMKYGNIGREPILSDNESADATIRLAFRAMMLAAKQMSLIDEGVLELLPSCSIDDVLLSDEQLKKINEPTGLFLNSLLVPLPTKNIHQSLMVRFSHRIYQEFFLSLYINKHPQEYRDITLPDNVMEFVNEIKTDDID